MGDAPLIVTVGHRGTTDATSVTRRRSPPLQPSKTLGEGSTSVMATYLVGPRATGC